MALTTVQPGGGGAIIQPYTNDQGQQVGVQNANFTTNPNNAAAGLRGPETAPQTQLQSQIAQAQASGGPQSAVIGNANAYNSAINAANAGNPAAEAAGQAASVQLNATENYNTLTQARNNANSIAAANTPADQAKLDAAESASIAAALPAKIAAANLQAQNNVIAPLTSRLNQGPETPGTSTAAPTLAAGQLQANQEAAGNPAVTRAFQDFQSANEGYRAALQASINQGVAGAQAQLDQLNKQVTDQQDIVKGLSPEYLASLTPTQITQLAQTLPQLEGVHPGLIGELADSARAGTQNTALATALKNGDINPTNYPTEQALQNAFPNVDKDTIHNAFINGNTTYLADQKNQAQASIDNIGKLPGGFSNMSNTAAGQLFEKAGLPYAMGFALANAQFEQEHTKQAEDKIKWQTDIDKIQQDIATAKATAAEVGQTPETKNLAAWQAMPDNTPEEKAAKDAFASTTGLDGSKTALAAADVAQKQADTAKANADTAKAKADALVALSGAGLDANGNSVGAGGGGTGNLSEISRVTNTGNIANDLNNPGNLRPGGVGDQYAIGVSTGPNGQFLVFKSAADGAKAQTADLQAKISGGSAVVKPTDTLDTLLNKYADNPSQSYKNTVESALGVDGNATVGSLDAGKLASAISKAEGFTGGNNDYANVTTTSNKVTPTEYGLLANVQDFNPNTRLDKDAWNYLSNYLNSRTGAEPTAASLGISTRTNSTRFADAKARASDLYTAATGQSLPQLGNLKTQQDLINANNKILNSNELSSDTVQKNFQLLTGGEIKDDVNGNATILNQIMNPIATALGDPGVASAMASNRTISKELGNLIAIKNAGGGTTVEDTKIAEDIFPPNSSQAAQSAIMTRLVNEAANIQQAVRDRNTQLQKAADPLQLHSGISQAAATPATTTTPTTQQSLASDGGISSGPDQNFSSASQDDSALYQSSVPTPDQSAAHIDIWNNLPAKK